MTDWIEHTGGPQPVGDDVWVEVDEGHIDHDCGPARLFDWNREEWFRWNVINQHLIRAARLEGFRLGLEAAMETVCSAEVKAAPEAGVGIDSLESGRFAGLAQATELIRALNPDTIAEEAKTT